MNSWTHKDGGEPKWTISDGYFTVKPGTGSIISKQYFGSCQLHIEFMTPSEIISQGQGEVIVEFILWRIQINKEILVMKFKF